jgi:hypothetical protein
MESITLIGSVAFFSQAAFLAALCCNTRHFLVIRYPCPSWTTAGQRTFSMSAKFSPPPCCIGGHSETFISMVGARGVR